MKKYQNLVEKSVDWCRLLAGVFLLLFIPSAATAGAKNGPYVVWVNLDKSSGGKRIDKIIKNFANKKSTDCDGQWLRGPLLYMEKRPRLITDDLIDDVFLKKSSSQMRNLNLALKNYKDDGMMNSPGLDGVIIYANRGNARMMSLTTGKRKIETVTFEADRSLPEAADIEAAFCALLPPITRRP